MSKLEDMKIGIMPALSLAAILLALAGVYYGMSNKITNLEKQVAEANQLAKAHDRALFELNLMLRVNGVIK